MLRMNPLGCSDDEWRARQDLAACYRIFNHLGWTELIYNHISLRVPGLGPDQRHFLINPFGLHYSEVKASNLLKVDLGGKLLSDSPWRVNAAGFAPHAALHGAIEHAHCVMHTHTTNGMAVASSAAGLSISNFYAAQLGGRVAYHDFEGITVHAEEGARLVKNIGDKPAVILRNHGLLAWGPSLASAFYTLFILQRACDIQVAGAALGPVIPIPEAVQRGCQRDAAVVNTNPDFGRENFDAMVRLIDRVDRTWCD
jgi:ribulose-5-phosphate 4-epimerase/fuculose-1-phosphate aldolase